MQSNIAFSDERDHSNRNLALAGQPKNNPVTGCVAGALDLVSDGIVNR